MTRHLVVVSAGIGKPSATRLLADRLTTAARGALAEAGVDVEVTVLELRELATDIAHNVVTGFPSGPLRGALDAVTSADGLIAVTPVYAASYSGLFKSFVDVLDPDGLRDLPVLLAATGGTERHSLIVDVAMRPLFAYLRARPVPTGVYAATSDWGAADPEAGLDRRITRAAGELAAEVTRGDRAVRDPWALDSPFEALLGNLPG